MVIYAGLPAVALSALPVTTQTRRRLHDAARDELRRRPDPRRSSRTWTSASSRRPLEYYVGVLAATILLIASNAGIIGVSRLTYSMGQHQQLPDRLRRISPRFRTPASGSSIFGADRLPRDHPRAGGVPRHAVRVRRDAVVHDRARVARRAEDQAPGGRAALAGPRQHPHPWVRPAAVRGLRRPRHGRGLRRRDGAQLRHAHRRRDLARRSASSPTSGIAAAKGLPLTETHKIVLPGPAVEHEVEYESVLVAFEDGAYDSEAVATAATARRPAQARDPRARDDHGAAQLADRRPAAGGGGPGGGGDRRGAGARRPAGDAATGRRCGRARPAGGSWRRRARSTRARSS